MRFAARLGALLVTLLLGSAGVVRAQTPAAPPRRVESATEHPEPPHPRPKIYLMCPQECFEDYLRQELSYFDVVRDPLLADFTIVIVRQAAGNGGERFSVTASRMAAPAETAAAARSFVADPAATTHTTRELLRGVVLRVLHTELIGTPFEDDFVVDLPARDAAEVSGLDDPWNYWVIAPELSAYGEAVGQFYSATFEGILTVRRITALSKLRLRTGYERVLNGYTLEDGSRPTSDIYRWSARLLYAHSLGEHLSVGGIVSSLGAEFENTRGHINVGGVVEANVFPFAENQERQLRFAYQIGAWSNWYFEETTRGKLDDHLPYHAFSVIADVNQRWGSFQWIGQLNQFLSDPKLFRVSTGLSMTLRIAAGLAMSVSGEFIWVNDQITLRERPITDEELLLWTAQQATDYNFNVELSLSYTFGSVLNTIVNPRFGRIDLQDD